MLRAAKDGPGNPRQGHGLPVRHSPGVYSGKLPDQSDGGAASVGVSLSDRQRQTGNGADILIINMTDF